MAAERERSKGAGPAPAQPAQSGTVISGIASAVTLDFALGTAHKTYKPAGPVRALYWLAFQAPFPYVSNRDAMEAARQRRRVVGLLTKFWYGEDLVAPVLDIHEEDDGRIAFVTRLVRGGAPVDRRAARRFLKGLTQRFIEAGLPTWQVSPHNPRAPGNLVAQPDGSYRIMDLESNLVAPVGPLSALVGAVRQRNFPAFDDIDPARLQAYLASHEAELRASLGREYAHLLEAARAYGEFAQRWHGREPRVVGRVVGLLLRIVDVPAWRRSLQRATAEGHARAQAHARRGIALWLSEGRISEGQAAALREVMQGEGLALALTNLGAHMAVSVPLRFPLGSLTRLSWTLSLRIRAEWQALRRGRDASAERAVHTLPVVFAAAVPGFGAGAYLLSKPLMQNRALAVIAFDLMLRRLPLGLYGRLRLARLTDALARTG